MKHPSGSIVQGGLHHQSADFLHEKIYYPVVGAVLDVYASDDNLNSYSHIVQNDKGYAVQARVLVTKQFTDSPLILPNVLILPPGGTGFSDFHEEIPKGTSKTIDGSQLNSDLYRIPIDKLDGDWCVVTFIGGSIHQPVMLSWFPHPSNRRDALTVKKSLGNLPQGRRLVKRFQGTKLSITSKGSVFVDTAEANSALTDDQANRDVKEDGGDIKVSVKNNREFEINFNPPVFEVDKQGNAVEPDLLHKNQIPQKRATDDTALRFTKDEIQAIAGEVIRLIADLVVVESGNIRLTEEGATENFVLGQQTKSLLSNVLNAIITHNHQTPAGPSGPPNNAPAFTVEKAKVDAELILSQKVFGE